MNQKRIERLLSEMKNNEMDRMIIANPKSIAYFTELLVEPGERMLVLLVSKEGEITLFLNNLFSGKSLKEINTVLFDDTDPYLELLAKRIGENETIGVDGNWPARFLLPLQQMKKQCCFVNGSCVVDHLRRIKDDEERRKMIISSAINDEVMAETVKLASGNYKEEELAELLKKKYLEKGCSSISFDPIVSYGKNAADPHHEPDNTQGGIGDCLVLDIGGIKDGYCSDMTRTVFLGEVSDKAREIYNIVLKANLAGIAAAKAGNRMADVDNAARNVIEQAGYGPYFTHRTGHSIGTEVHETGDVSRINNDIIEVGQVFSVEPGIYIPEEKIGVRIEDLVLITEEGNKVLNSYTKELQVIPFER